MSTSDAPIAAPTTTSTEPEQIRNNNSRNNECDADREDNEDDEGLERRVTSAAGSYGLGKTGRSNKREAIDLPPSPAQSLKGDSRTPSSKPGGGGDDKSKKSRNNDDGAGTDQRRKSSTKHTDTGTAQKRKKPPTEGTISVKQKQAAAAADVPSSSGASGTSSAGGGKSDSNAPQSQKERRLAMSRINAQRNRDRKRVIMGMMQEDKKRLTIANAKLKDENELLRVVIATLKQQRAAGATAVAASASLAVNPMVQGLQLPPQNLYANSASSSGPAAGPTDLLAQIGLLSQQQQRQQHQSMGSNASPAGLLSSILSSPSSGGNNEAVALPMLLALLGQSRQTDFQGTPPSFSIPGSMTQMLPSVGGTIQPAAVPAPASAESSQATSNVHAALSEMASTPSGRETLLKLIAGSGNAGSNQLQRALGSGMPGVQKQQRQNPGPQINSQFGWKRSSSSRSDDERGLTVEQQLQLLNSISSEQSPPVDWGGVGIQQGGNSMLGEARGFLSNHAAGQAPSASGININQPQDLSQNALLQQLLGSMQQGNASAMSNSTAQGPATSQQQTTIQSLLSRFSGGSTRAFGPGSS